VAEIVPHAAVLSDEQASSGHPSTHDSVTALSIFPRSGRDDATGEGRTQHEVGRDPRDGANRDTLSHRPMTFAVRDATPEDYPVFARLFPALGVADPLLTPAQFAARMLPTVVLVEEASEPVGYSFWQVHGARAHVVHVVVDERVRGRGAGRALMEEVRRRVLAEKCSRWVLNVKQDNAPAIRLYEGCGLAIEQEGWGMRADWSELATLPAFQGEVAAYTPESAEDVELAARFGETPERLRILRSREGIVLLGLREAGAPVAFAAFDPSFPGVYPVRLARVELARPLFDALRPHGRDGLVQVFVEGDHALYAALRACGAHVRHATYRMGASLA
jgi:ribosomal protein S18 acetylase RimI-like enzyme